MKLMFKYKIGQHVYFDNKLCEIISRTYMETKKNNIIKYNLKCGEEYWPNVWESELSTFSVVK